MCFVDGTLLLVVAATAVPGVQFLTSATAGLPGGRPITAASPTYSNALLYDTAHKPAGGYVNPPADPWALPPSACLRRNACSNLDCRIDTRTSISYGPRQCFWAGAQVAIWPSIATGVYCTMFNSNDERMGTTGSILPLNAVSQFVADTQRTPNGQAFIVDSTNDGLLGSTFTQPFQGAWSWSRATYDPVEHAFYNNSMLPIKFIGVGTSSIDQRDQPFPGAVVMNASYVKVDRNCFVSPLTSYVVCQATVQTYGYEPLQKLREAAALTPASGLRQGTITADGKTYYYAVDDVHTLVEGVEVPGLRWSVVVLTPQQDVLSEVAKGRTYSIVATCCFFVVAAGCCFALFTIFLRPLADLEDRMLLTANLADDSDKSEDLSALNEIRNMQKSFYRMRAQLRKLKSFVPQSVLAALEDETEDEDDKNDGTVPKAASDAGAANDRSREYDAESGPPTDTKSTRSKRSSRGQAVVTGSGIAVRALNIQLGLTRKVVTILVFNVRGLHAGISGCAVDEVTQLHSKLIESFNAIVSAGKGIVDSFQGDRFVATFNAVTANAQHAVRAAVAAQEMLAAFARLRSPFPRAGVGIATGDALVGNGGCDAMRRFCTIGRVYTQATVMERLTKQFASTDVLLTQGTAAQLAHEFYIEALDVLQLEGQNKPTPVYALRDRMSHAMEEWNYAMQQNEEKDMYSKLNEAFMAYCDGNLAHSRVAFAAVPPPARECAGYITLDSLLATHTDARVRACESQGRFFAQSFGSSSTL